jgi:hypothetical protein
MLQIVFIRHGEKSKNDPVHLNEDGKIRAENLPDYFLHPYNEFNVPKYVYVMNHHHQNNHKSQRCLETMLPTIKTGKLEYELVNRSHTIDLARKLLSHKNINKTVIVCWEHSRIVDMVNELGAYHVCSWGLDPEADTSDTRCFNATWVVDFTNKGLRLRVFRQFEIIDGYPIYQYPRTKIWYDRSFAKKEHSCVIS